MKHPGVFLILLELLLAVPAAAQVPSYRPAELDHLLERIALYPDPLLAQVLAAATFPDQLSDAAHWGICIMTSPARLSPK
ncbi:MAG: DUF3300 domain-containing protein [Deltaproteobacteria bacterium]|nr:DUF3300 domain-containing protein [Deltaproteobacteria bacterium]